MGKKGTHTRYRSITTALWIIITIIPSTSMSNLVADEFGDEPIEQVDSTELPSREYGNHSTMEDPFESMNRKLYKVHMSLDDHLFDPMFSSYLTVTPKGLHKGFKNVIRNLQGPLITINFLIQTNPTGAGIALSRFLINSTIGLAGIIDVADYWGLKRTSNSIAYGMGYYGIGSGPFLFVPIYGPTDTRDVVGLFVDPFLDPLTYLTHNPAWSFLIALLNGLLTYVDNKETVLTLRDTSMDPYLTFRVFVAQGRADKVEALRRSAPWGYKTEQWLGKEAALALYLIFAQYHPAYYPNPFGN